MLDLQRSISIVVLLVSLTSPGALLLADSSKGKGDEKPPMVNLWQPGDPGQPLHIHGQVLGADGKPIEGAKVGIRQADGTGEYTDRYQTSLTTDDEGVYRFGTVLPGQYFGVKHIHVTVSHPAHGSIGTQILFKGDENLDESVQVDRAIHLEEARIDGRTYLFGRFDVVLKPGGG